MRWMRPVNCRATGLGDLQVFGADAERFGAGRHRGMREKVSRQEIDRRRAEPARDITVGGGLIDFARRADLQKFAIAE